SRRGARAARDVHGRGRLRVHPRGRPGRVRVLPSDRAHARVRRRARLRRDDRARARRRTAPVRLPECRAGPAGERGVPREPLARGERGVLGGDARGRARRERTGLPGDGLRRGVLLLDGPGRLPGGRAGSRGHVARGREPSRGRRGAHPGERVHGGRGLPGPRGAARRAARRRGARRGVPRPDRAALRTGARAVRERARRAPGLRARGRPHGRRVPRGRRLLPRVGPRQGRGGRTGRRDLPRGPRGVGPVGRGVPGGRLVSARTPRATLDVLERRVLAGPSRLGRTRLVSVDGPAGSGKTTLAGDLAEHLRARGTSVEVLHLDDMLEGWTGLEVGVAQLLTTVLVPLSQGRPGSYRRYDWHAKAWAEDVVVP